MSRKSLVFSLLFLSGISALSLVSFQSNVETPTLETKTSLNPLGKSKSEKVNNWATFKTAAQNPLIDTIVLTDDIDLSGLSDIEVDIIPTMENKTIIGNGYSFSEFDSSYLGNNYLITNAINVSFENVGFEGVEHFIDNFTYTVTDTTTQEAFKDVTISNANTPIENESKKGWFIGDITFLDEDLTHKWNAIDNLLIMDNNFADISFTKGSGLFSGEIKTTSDNINYNAISIINNNWERSNTFKKDKINLLGSISEESEGHFISLSNLIVSNNVFDENKKLYATLIGNQHIDSNLGSNYQVSGLINNNYIHSEQNISSPMDIKVSDLANENDTYDFNLYYVNSLYQTNQKIEIFNNTFSNQFLNNQIHVMNQISWTQYEFLNKYFDQSFGKNGYVLVYDQNTGQIEDIKLSYNPEIFINNSFVKETKKGTVTRIDLDFQLIYNSSVPMNDYLELSNVKLKIGSSAIILDETLKTNDGNYSASFKTNISENDLKNTNISLSATINNNTINNQTIKLIISDDFIEQANIKEYNPVARGITSTLIGILIVIFILGLVIALSGIYKKQKEKKLYAKIINESRYNQNAPLNRTEDDQYEFNNHNYYENNHYYESHDYYENDYEIDDYQNHGRRN